MIAGIIISILLLILISLISIYKLSVEIYFLNFKLNKHPYIENLIRTKLYQIAENEGVPVFELPINQVNNNKIRKKEDRTCGVYVSLNEDNEKNRKLIREMQETYNKIIKLEQNFKKSYNDLYHSIYEEAPLINKHEYCVPRIEIGIENGNKNNWDKIYFYKTFAHELGHHFAITRENNNSEERADEIAEEIIYNNTPKYFKLIYGSIFNTKISNKEFYKLIWLYYWNYYRKQKKLNKL